MKILKDDQELIKLRIKEIKLELRELAKEFHEVLNQGSETWHDNAPWDAAKRDEAAKLSELEELERVLKTASIVPQTEPGPIGKLHKLKFNDREVKIFLAGDYSPRAGQVIDGHTVVTTQSPIAQQLLSQNT